MEIICFSHRWLQKNLHFLTVKFIRGEGVQMSTINIANQPSVKNSSCVPAKFNHHHHK